MTQYINKTALVSEIDEKKRKISPNTDWYFDEYTNGYIDAHKDILSFLDTLEVKEVDLDKEIDDYIDTMEVWEIQEAPLTSIENTAKYFFELGMKAKKG